MSLVDKIKQLGHFKIKSSRTRSILLYSVFVIISAILWCFLTLNNSITVEYSLPVKIVKPANVRFLSDVPDTITVTVTDKGSSFVKRILMPNKKLELRFSEYSDGENTFKVDAAQLRRLIAREFSRTATLVTILPENITARYTDQPGKRVPVVVDVEVEPAMLHTRNGMITRDHDSVLVFADYKTLNEITEVYTYHVKEIGLTDTLRRRVSLSPIKGAVMEPRSIEITIPIEKLVTRSQRVPISVRNAPSNINVVLFPSNVEVTYRTPMSEIHNDNTLTVVVDYNNINVNTPGNKVPIQAGEVPGVYEDVRLAMDSVEYIIEKH